MTPKQNRLRQTVVLARATQMIEALDTPLSTPPQNPPHQSSESYTPEFVSPIEAQRDLEDPNPRIRRYAQTLIGLHEETERRADMQNRYRPSGEHP